MKKPANTSPWEETFPKPRKTRRTNTPLDHGFWLCSSSSSAAQQSSRSSSRFEEVKYGQNETIPQTKISRRKLRLRWRWVIFDVLWSVLDLGWWECFFLSKLCELKRGCYHFDHSDKLSLISGKTYSNSTISSWKIYVNFFFKIIFLVTMFKLNLNLAFLLKNIKELLLRK